MGSARVFATGLGAALALIMLSGCAGLLHQGSSVARFTPPDPPPIPARKPATPASFQLVSAGQLASIEVAGGYAGTTARSLPTAQPMGARIHRVAAGETVYGIARRYGTDMAALVRLNRISPPYRIVRGQTLVLPGGQGASGVQMAALQQPVSQAVEAAPIAAAPLDGGEDAGQPRPRAETTAALIPAPAPTAAIPSPPPLHGGKFLWPISGPILSPYGPKSDGLHNDGVNIAAARGTPIRAAENGVVAYTGNELRGFGNLLLIKHSDGWVTAYAHADEILVRRGQKVERGQVVARVGSSGNVSEPQLHFEVRKGVRTIDPGRLLEAREVASN